jgi:negative regulator of sigma E activity
MSEDRLDLSPLDLARDPARMRRMTSAIMTGAARALAERRASVIAQLSAWSRGIFSMAAVVSLAAAPALFHSAERSASPKEPRPPDLNRAALLWATSGRAPTMGELLDVVGGDRHDEIGE